MSVRYPSHRVTASKPQSGTGSDGATAQRRPEGVVAPNVPEKRVADDLVFLHVSDIHFHYRNSASPHDPDQDLRNELLRNIRHTAGDLGKFTGILIAGDIAHSGADAEYGMAKAWIDQLRTATSCREDRVWTVPGNHDIDRGVFEKSEGLRDLRSKLRSVPTKDLDQAIRGKLDDSLYANALFSPLEAYNRFAALYHCEVSPSRPYWEHGVLVLSDGTRLKLRGVTSPLISDKHDSDKEDSKKLVLGKFQSLCPREDGVEYLVLCHHPSSWLRDGDVVDDTLTARARLQLFGHKHSQRVYRKNDSLVIHAGALQPDRNENDWEPRFNFITLSVKRGENGRLLQVRLLARVWDKQAEAFKPDVTESGESVRSYDLPMSGESSAENLQRAAETVRIGASEPVGATEKAAPEARTFVKETFETAAVMDRERHLRYRFLSLPHAVRLAIANKHGLIRNEDEGIKDSELWSRILKRAYEGGLIEALWESVEERYATLFPSSAPTSPTREGS